jgi:peptidoglycan hydrolase CwlO-like protein
VSVWKLIDDEQRRIQGHLDTALEERKQIETRKGELDRYIRDLTHSLDELRRDKEALHDRRRARLKGAA